MSKLDLITSPHQLKVGISQCLLGDKVRYDGEGKRSSFAADVLKPYVDFQAICPEMAIGLPSPRPTLGLYQHRDQSVMMCFNDLTLSHLSINEEMTQFCQSILPNLSDLHGYIACAKSPSCGLANAQVYELESRELIGLSDGVFTENLRKLYPWLPVEDNNHLTDPEVQIHFVIRILALSRLNQLRSNGLSRHALLTFHSRYKSLLLAHSQPQYRKLGPFVAKIEQWNNLDDFFASYRQQFMQLLETPASKENHTNVLMHLQGYFNRYLTAIQKQELTQTILAYRNDELSLNVPITCLKAYLLEFPNEYLSIQYYFDDYPLPLNIDLN